MTSKTFGTMSIALFLSLLATVSLLARPYIVGADISWILEDEHMGSTYWDEGQQKDVFQILKDHGVNFIRVRTFVDPCADGGYTWESYSAASGQECWCDLEHTIELAERIKEYEMGFLLDFHMSDTWASIGHQYVPSAWAGMNDEDMRAAAYEYTRSNVQTLVDLGLRPDMVQVGNEINTRMSGVSISNPDRFAALINAGVRGVRDVDPTIKIVMQHGRPRPDGDFMGWYNTIKDRVDFDFIGGSTYGTTNGGDDWRDMFGNVVADGIPVMSLEYTGGRTALINTVMNEMPNEMGLGTFIWEPTRYGDPFFDRDGNRYTANNRLDELLWYAQQFQATLPDFVQLNRGPRYGISTSSGVGGYIQQSPPGDSIYQGNQVEFEAVALDGWQFSGWSGDHTGSGSNYTIESLDDHVNLQAAFEFVAKDSSSYEGEGARMISAVFEDEHPGFSGSGYANFNNELGSALEFFIVVAEDGSKTIRIDYSNGSDTQRPVSVSLNGTVVMESMGFSPTADWDSWDSQMIDLNLTSGVNTLTLTSVSEDGGPNIDRLELIPEGPVTLADLQKETPAVLGYQFDEASHTLSWANSSLNLQVYSVDGTPMIEHHLEQQSGSQQFVLPAENWSNGVYVLKVRSGSMVKTHMFQVVR